MNAVLLRKPGSSINSSAVIKIQNPVFFLCMLALLVFFSHAGPLQAHEIPGIPSRAGTEDNHSPDSITAKDVRAGNMEDMKAFMLHAMAHMEQLIDYNTGLAPFLQLIEEEGGDWRKDSIYIFRTSKDGVIQQPHPYYPPAQGGILSHKNPVMKGLMDELQEKEDGVACRNYTFRNEERAACAVKFNLHLDSLSFPLPTILVGGLHHNFSDVSFSNLKCPHYVPETSAVDVVDRDTLKKFVDEFAQFYVEWRERVGLLELINSVSCFRVLPWKNDSIYLFAMAANNRLVVLNGNTPSLENKSLNVEDDNGTNVGDLLVEAVKDLPHLPSGEGAFVEYLWDDPTTPDDDIRDAEGNLIPGRAPGNSPKITYVTSIPSTDGQGQIIWGSGIYPETGDDNGCAIAEGADAPGSVLLNFFMTVLFLLPAVFLKKRSGIKKAFAQSGPAAFVVCALATLVFLSGPDTAVAHEGEHNHSIIAGGVDASDQDDMLEFVLHAKAHWEAIDDPNENIRFEKSLTVDGGDWKNGTIYLMVIDEDGTIYTHAHDPEAQNGTLNATELIAKADEGGCVDYVLNGENRVACAVKFEHPVWKSELILIGGLHHESGDVSFYNIRCPYFISEIIDEEPYFKQGITANKVTDSDTLKNFVKEFKKHFTEQVEQAGQTPASLASVRNCWRALPWKHGAVYLFVMTESDQLVFFNGNSPALENGTLDVVDDNGCNVGDEVVRVVNIEPRQCRDLGLLPGDAEGFVEYLWDDPTDSAPALPGEGTAPGDVPKLSYVERVSFPGFLGGQPLIVGSGYHPGTSNDDGGCAVAATSARGGALFNSLLIVSVLFSAALWKRRPMGKQAVSDSRER